MEAERVKPGLCLGLKNGKGIDPPPPHFGGEFCSMTWFGEEGEELSFGPAQLEVPVGLPSG